jgi:hypothetical protein
MAMYSQTSPWAYTGLSHDYLDILNIRPVSSEPDDYSYELSTYYNHRPDLLANDLYGTPKLWWVFMQRNMDIINDPIFDFVAGTVIRIPHKDSLFKVLGL